MLPSVRSQSAGDRSCSCSLWEITGCLGKILLGLLFHRCWRLLPVEELHFWRRSGGLPAQETVSAYVTIVGLTLQTKDSVWQSLFFLEHCNKKSISYSRRERKGEAKLSQRSTLTVYTPFFLTDTRGVLLGMRFRKQLFKQQRVRTDSKWFCPCAAL